MAKKKTAVEIMNEGMEEEAASAWEIIEEAKPKTPLEAAFDRATGFKPEDAVKAILGKDGEAPEPPAEAEKPSERRDWVKEAYECFVKDAKDIDPTDPVKAIEVYFERQATDELKARCKAEGKDAEDCWKFITAVARKALGGSSGHIDPAVVYAIAMHWFEDVPKDWDARGRSPATPKAAKPKKPAETPSEVKKDKAKAKRAQRPATPKRKSNTQAAAAKAKAAKQGFFFEMLETPAEGGTEK